MNRKIARKLLAKKLDGLVNGEESVEAQEAKISKEKHDRKKEKIRLKYQARAAANTGTSDGEGGSAGDEPNSEAETVKSSEELKTNHDGDEKPL